MNDDKDKYLDPAQNPFIQLGDADGNPRPKDDGEKPLDEDYRIPLPDIKTGLFPGEKKAAESSSSPDLSKVELFMKGREKWAVYGAANNFLFEVKEGQDGLIIEESPGETRPIHESDIQLILDGAGK